MAASMVLAAAMGLFMIAGATGVPHLSGIVWSRGAGAASTAGPIPATHVVRRLDVMGSLSSDPLNGFFWSPHGLSWSPDGRLFAATPDTGGRQAWIWTRDGTLVHQITRDGHYSATYPGQNIAFVDGDSRILVPPGSGAPGAAMSLYDLATGALLHDIAGPLPDDPEARRNAAATIVPSPDQTMVAVLYAIFDRKPVGIYSTQSWQRVASLNDGADLRLNPPMSLAFSPDSRRLAIGRANGSVIIYDVRTYKVVREIDAFTQRLHLAPATSVCFSPDGDYLAVGGWAVGSVNIPPPGKTLQDNIMTPIIQPYPLQVFRVADGKSVASAPGQKTPIRDVKWNRQGQLIAFIGADDLPRLWSPFDPALPRIIPGLSKSHDLAFSPDGSILAVSQHFQISFVAIGDQR